MLRKKNIKKILAATLFFALILQNTTVVLANTYVTDVRDYIVTSKDDTGIPKTVSYVKDGISTTLYFKKVNSYTVTETKQVPVYRTDTKTVTVSVPGSSDPNSYSSTYNYSDGSGYSGTLQKSGGVYVSGGQAPQSKTATASRSSMSNNLPSSISYDDGVFRGTLYGQGVWTETVQTGGSYTPKRYLDEYLSGYFHWESRDGVAEFWSGAKGSQITSKYPNDWMGGSTGYGNPAKPRDFYGRTNPASCWEIVSQYWVAGNSTVPAKNDLTDSYSGIFWDTKKRDYLRFVKVTYRHFIPEQDTRTWGTKYNQNYSGTVWSADTRTYAQNYSGTVSKQVIDHYETVPVKWRANVLYEGYINYPPIADFSMPAYTLTNMPVNVVNMSSDKDGQIVSNTWSISPSVSNNLGSNGGTLSFINSGTYAVTLTVKDNDGGTASVTKNITVYKDTEKPVVTLKITPNPVDEDQTITYNGTYTCPTGISSYVYTLTNLATGKSYVYNNSTPPINFEEAGLPYGNYKVSLKALGKDVDYGNGIIAKGKWSDEVSADLVVMPSLAINSLKMTNIVNPPRGTTVPINYPVSTPTRIKAGYRMDFNLNVKGGDVVNVKLYANGNELPFYTADGNKVTDLIINKNRADTNIPFSLYLDRNIAKETIIDMKFVLTKKYPDNTQKSIVNAELGWRFAQIVGSSKEDININLTK